MFGKRELKSDEVKYSNLNEVKEYIKERIRSLSKYGDEKTKEEEKELDVGYYMFRRELGTLKLILFKLDNVITMHPITEIKIIIEIKDSIGSKGSNDFTSLRELMSFLKMKEKIHIADALGYDPIANKLK